MPDAQAAFEIGRDAAAEGDWRRAEAAALEALGASRKRLASEDDDAAA